MNYKSRTYEIEAIHFTRGQLDALMEFTEGSTIRIERAGAENSMRCTIETQGSTITAAEGNYIVKGNEGEFSIAKADTFEARYEIVAGGDD